MTTTCAHPPSEVIELAARIVELKQRIPFTNLQGPAAMQLLLSFAHHRSRAAGVALTPDCARAAIEAEADEVVSAWLSGCPAEPVDEQAVFAFGIRVATELVFHLAVCSQASPPEVGTIFGIAASLASISIKTDRVG